MTEMLIPRGGTSGNKSTRDRKLAETGRGRELVRVNLGYRVAVGGGPNTWPAMVQVEPRIGHELDDPDSKRG
ncbi:hypothetical protein Tco_0763223 [Tanacetum coccineum]